MAPNTVTVLLLPLLLSDATAAFITPQLSLTSTTHCKSALHPSFLPSPHTILQNTADDDENNNNNADNDEIDTLSNQSVQMFDEMTNQMFGSSANKKTSLGDLYDNEELSFVLSLHNQLASDETIYDNDDEEEEGVNGAAGIGNLHDLVMAAISEPPINNLTTKQAPPPPPLPNTQEFTLDQETKTKVSKISAIASDVDGTILSKDQSIHPRTRLAIKRAIQLASSARKNEKIGHFFPATGKSRKGALDSLGPELGSLLASTPGVYIQGLYCIDSNGNVVFEKKLSQKATAAAENLAKEYELSIVAYDGDDLYTTKVTEIVEHLHTFYGEPMPRLIDTEENNKDLVMDLAEHEPCMHKLLLMDDDVDKLRYEVRPKLEALADEYGATVTQALPTMLEWLPKGCSKALGVSKLCEALNINPQTELLAMGDAENDVEMLEMACIGVAVGNGCARAKEAADFVVKESNCEGGVGVAMELFAFGDF